MGSEEAIVCTLLMNDPRLPERMSCQLMFDNMEIQCIKLLFV
jgi:hypothetical protein